MTSAQAQIRWGLDYIQRAYGTLGCQLPCDEDCEIGRVHCWNWHRPNHKPDWHDPAACDRGTA